MCAYIQIIQIYVYTFGEKVNCNMCPHIVIYIHKEQTTNKNNKGDYKYEKLQRILHRQSDF